MLKALLIALAVIFSVGMGVLPAAADVDYTFRCEDGDASVRFSHICDGNEREAETSQPEPEPAPEPSEPEEEEEEDEDDQSPT